MTRKSQFFVLFTIAILSQGLGLAADSNAITASPNDVVIAHVAEGGQWSTSITLINLSAAPVSYTLRFYSDSGAPLTLPLVGGTPSSLVSGNLNVSGSHIIQTAGLPGATLQGWAQLTASSLIGGFAVFKSHLAGQTDSEAVVPFSSKFDHRFVLAFDNTNGYVIGGALVNASAFETVTVVATMRDEAGAMIGNQSVFTMAPMSHMAFSFPQQFASTTNKKGTAEFSTTSVNLSGLGLRFSPAGPFTSFHALSAPGW